MSRLFDEQGRNVQLGTKLGEGGEGAVYRLAGQNTTAVKVYGAPLPPEKIRKLRIITGHDSRLLKNFIAWPHALVVDDRRRVKGLLLPVVQGGKDVHHLYTPSSRRQHFPSADWRFLVHVATNTARAFAAVHNAGFVIGDVNPGSILVLSDGTVRLIDTDSFQVPVPGGPPLLCTVAVPLFLPPELHNARLDSTVRTPDHDAFGLAITVFQLLMLGRHPYAGRYLGHGDMPIEKAIAENRFAYGQHASSRQMQRPPNTVGLEILPPAVATLFEKAFQAANNKGQRPTAEHWARTLQDLAAKLTKCGQNATHQYVRELRQCPWCTFEQRTNVVLFGHPPVVTPQRHEAEYQRLLQQIRAVPTPTPALPAIGPARVPPNPAAREGAGSSGIRWGAAVTGIAVILMGLILFPFGLLALPFGIALGIYGANRPKKHAQLWIRAYEAAQREYQAANADFNRVNQFPKHQSGRYIAANAERRWNDLPRLRSEKIRALDRNKREDQLRQFLQRILIEHAQIKGVGPARVAMLSAFGIDTAWDVSASRVAQVPQFGPVLTDRVVAWRRQIERTFVYNASSPLPAHAAASIDKEIEGARRQILNELRRALDTLQTASRSESDSALTAAHRMTHALTRLRQAEADYTAATGKVPT